MARVTRSYRGSAADERMAERRARLVAAGVEVFGTTGFRTAAIDRICAEAGLSKRYFYESFRDREALLLAAFTHCSLEIRASGRRATLAAGPTSDPAARTRAALYGYFTALAQDPRMARLTLVEILGVNEQVDTAYRAESEWFAATVEALAEVPAAGAGPTALDRHLIAQGMVGAVILIATQWVLEGMSTPADRVAAAAVVVVETVLERLRADPQLLRVHGDSADV